jgi:chemotaxis signal transduction protein
MNQLLLFSVDKIQGAIYLLGISHVIRMIGLIRRNTGSATGYSLSINFHGRTIPVISVRRLFGLPESQPCLTDMLIIARAGQDDVALWVDSTSGIREIAPELFQDLPSSIPGTRQTVDGIVIISDLCLLISSYKDYTAYSAGEHPENEKLNSIPLPPGEPESLNTSYVSALLAERAKKIAQPEETLTDTKTAEVLRFRLAYREYAIEMQYIREVILTGEITPVPGTPEYISGLCVVRGEIISLVDLRVLLSITERGLTDLNRVIVLTNHTLTFGILADYITGIGTLELNRIDPPDPGIFPGAPQYIKGIADLSLVVLDAAALFSDSRMIIDES